MRVELASQAARAVRKLARADQERVVAALEAIGRDPRPSGKRVKAIKGGGHGLVRYRVGDLRILYEVSDPAEVVLVHAVVARKDLETWLRRQR